LFTAKILQHKIVNKFFYKFIRLTIFLSSSPLIMYFCIAIIAYLLLALLFSTVYVGNCS